MRRTIFGGLALFIGLALSSVAFGQTGKICLLYFERKQHPFHKVLVEKFAGNPKIVIYDGAKPIDIIDCLYKHTPEQIFILAHAFEYQENKTNQSHFTLGYYRPRSPEETRKAFLDNKHTVEQQMADLEKTMRMMSCFENDRNRCEKKHREYEELHESVIWFNGMEPGQTMYELLFGYDKAPFYDRIFERISDVLKKTPVPLQKIHLMACEPDELVEAYPTLQNLLAEEHIQFNTSPRSPVLSWFFGRNVSSYDEDWIKGVFAPFEH